MKIPKVFPILFLVLALVGFADATYLTVEHFLKAIPPCSVTSGCETVLTSQWSTIIGMPVSLLGTVYYLLMTILIIAYLSHNSKKIILLASYFSIAGFVAAIWFISLQLFVIKQICIYCMVADVTSIILFLVGFYIIRKNKTWTSSYELPNLSSDQEIRL